MGRYYSTALVNLFNYNFDEVEIGSDLLIGEIKPIMGKSERIKTGVPSEKANSIYWALE